jgi:hypothetical protein
MPETIAITNKEVEGIFRNIPPTSFRFANEDDFHKNGVRHPYVKIYIYQEGKVAHLTEYSFNQQTEKPWLQWLLESNSVFIKIGPREGKYEPFNLFVEPTYDYMKIKPREVPERSLNKATSNYQPATK